ncbi:MAG: 23S rRNA (pseudouridine(1915)-N(3))-methyltransferase RlmH [Polyangiaceae bacterium]|nr:23S rRNA (pseudouridine(1915)-N(3))-methyltransferase RlmH [Polyangiaceae bacterium]
MRVVVAAVGRLRDRSLRAVADDYLARVRHYARCDEVEVRDRVALERALPEGACRVALEVDGEVLTSVGFARRIERWGATGKGVIGFVLGGADGIPEAVSCGATARISLSPLTLPHRLARVVLYEQLYRAFTILRGEPYAREG